MPPRRSPTCHGGETCLTTFWSFKIDVVRVLLDPLNVCLILICINNHKLLAHSESIMSSFIFCPFSGIILDGIHKNFKLFPIYDFRLTIFHILVLWRTHLGLFKSCIQELHRKIDMRPTGESTRSIVT